MEFPIPSVGSWEKKSINSALPMYKLTYINRNCPNTREFGNPGPTV